MNLGVFWSRWLHSYRTIFILGVTTVSLLSGCSSLPTEINKTASFAYQDTEITRPGKASAALIKGKKSGTGTVPLGRISFLV